MTVKQLAKKFKVDRAVVYDVIYNLEIKDGVGFKRSGRTYLLEGDRLELVLKALKKRGYCIDLEFLSEEYFRRFKEDCL